MGKQAGRQTILGTVDGLNYYQTAENGLLVRKKSSLNKERVLKDPAFEQSRKASSEFGRASAASHLIRSTLAIAGREIAETRMYNRLTSLLRGAMATDVLHPIGQRTLSGADLGRLVGFEWNKYRGFGELYSGAVQFSIDASTGLLEVDIPAINGAKDFERPKNASHVQLILEGGGFDFELGEGVIVRDQTDWLSLKRKHPVQVLSGQLAVKPGMRLVLGVGIRFGEELNDAIYPIDNRQYKGFVIGAVV